MTWNMIQSIASREQLALSVAGNGAELGVAAGDYSLALLANPRLELVVSIDRWCDHHDDAEMRRAKHRLGAFGQRSLIIHDTFEGALSRFVNGFFDFIYVDGYAHAGQEEGRTLDDWWPKLKSGGVMAGHDYCRHYPATIAAVNRFVAARNLPLHVTGETFASWITLKP